jgi:predicted Fe-S protein YdhL (DUF1289 family)
MDDENHYCIGCWRSIDEIATWSVLSDDQKRAILQQLLKRKQSNHL